MISKKMNEQVLGGALTHHKKFLAGPYKGYYITIDYRPPVYIVYIHATFDNFPGKAQFEGFLKNHQESMQYLSKAEAKDHTIKLRIIEPKPKKLIPSVLNETIEPIIRQLLGCRYVTGCIDCGDNDGEIDCYEISGYHHYICEECIVRIKQNYKEIQERLEGTPSNPILGTIGALCGSILGVIAWIALDANKLFAWLAGFIILFLTYKGYEKFGGRVDKKGFIISTTITCVMIFLANHSAWIWAIMNVAKEQGYSIVDILLLSEFLNTAPAIVFYTFDLLLGYAIAFGIGRKLVKSIYRKSTGNYSIKKMNLQ